MRAEEILGDPVKDIRVDSLEECSKCFRKLLKTYSEMGGFSSRFLAKAYELVREMLSDKECTVFIAFTANLVATGLRGVLAYVVRKGFVDAVITTGGTVDHDIARSLSEYYEGEFEMDDTMLREAGIHRLGNVFIPVSNYGPVIESFTHELLEELVEKRSSWSPSELLEEVGLRLNDESSILYQAAKRGVPVFVPGIVDSAFGTAIMTFNELSRSRGSRGIALDLVKDLRRIADIVYSSRKLGAIILGGGIAKHHTIWWAQFKEGLDYAVYVTTAVEWDGSLSGARTREAISWGKIKRKAKHVTVPADATIVFPILILAVASCGRVKPR